MTTTTSKRGKVTTSKVSPSIDETDPTVPFSTRKRSILGRLIDCDDMEHLVRAMRDEVSWYDSNQIIKELGPKNMHSIIGSNMSGPKVGDYDNRELMESSGHRDPIDKL